MIEGHFCTHDYSDELERAADKGYDEGNRDGRKEGEALLQDYRKRLQDELDKRRMRAALPYALNGETMTLDEVEEMINAAT